MTLGIRPGISLDNALRDLRSIAMKGRNSLPQRLDEALQEYLTWVNEAEMMLSNYFTDSGLEASLRGTVHWHIRSNLASDFRPYELLTQELTAQTARLEALSEQLTAVKARLDAAPGTFAVLDTHVLLHYEPPSQVRWTEVVSKPEVRLVIPLRVIEELDAKKYTGRDDLADRARRLLAQLRGMLSPTAGLPVELRENVTVEVPVERGPRVRPLDADYEVLLACMELQALQQPVVLVTDDTGFALRASSAEVPWVAMPEQYRRTKNSAPPG